MHEDTSINYQTNDEKNIYFALQIFSNISFLINTRNSVMKIEQC